MCSLEVNMEGQSTFCCPRLEICHLDIYIRVEGRSFCEPEKCGRDC